MRPILRDTLQNHRGHTVLAFPAGSAPLVIDTGAHKGEFATSVTKAWGAHCHAVEASPVLFQVLQIPQSTVAYNFAVSGADGEITFTLNDNPEASHVGAGAGGAGQQVTVPARGLAGFIDEVAPGDIDLLKLDIEGSEIAAIGSLTDAHLARIGQITVEFHDFCGYVTVAEVDATQRRLEQAGFEAFNFSVFTRGDMLFVNRKHHPLTFLDRLRIGATRWKRAVARRLGRMSVPG